MKLLSHIWPWSTISRLRQELADEKEFCNRFREIIDELDPHYWEKLRLEAMLMDPRTNLVMTGIKVPQ